MGVGDHQLDAAQPPARERAQEVGPEGLGLRRADGQAEHLAPAVAIDADRDDDRDDAAVAPRLHIGGVEPDIGPVALERTIEERLDLAVNLAAQAGNLALRYAGHAHRLDQLVDRACRHALDVGFLDHGRQRLLAHPPRLQKARKIAALPELRDAQLHRPGPGLPVAVAIAVAMVQPFSASLAVPGAGQSLDPERHQPLGGKRDHLAQKIRVGVLLQKRLEVHHIRGHRRVLGSRESLATKPYRRLTMTTAVDKQPAAA
jgi:hypothetical protein